MLSLVLLIFFLIQFLVALGVLIFVIILARPEVPFSGDGPHDKPSPDDHDHLLPRPPEGKAPASGKNASGTSTKPTKRERNLALSVFKTRRDSSSSVG